MRLLKKDYVNGVGFELPITLEEENEDLFIAVDGVDWCAVSNEMHGFVLLQMMKEHLSEYMHYEQTNEGGNE